MYLGTYFDSCSSSSGEVVMGLLIVILTSLSVSLCLVDIFSLLSIMAKT